MDRGSHNAMAQLLRQQHEGTRAIITELRRERGESAEFEMEYFEYVWRAGGLDFIEIGAAIGAAAEGSFITSKESTFYGTAFKATARDQANETTVLDHYLALVTRQGDDRVMSNGFVHAFNFFGSAERPGFVPRPELIAGASTMRLQLVNRAATAIRVYASLAGYKVRDKQLASHTRK